MKHRIIILCVLVLSFECAFSQYVVYPIPQKVTALEGTASFSSNVCVICDEGIDQATRNRVQQVLEEHGLSGNFLESPQECTSVIRLKINPSVAVDKKYDAYNLSLSTLSNGMAELIIEGQHTNAVFYGLATFEQMLDQFGQSALPRVEINDYADQMQRGLVEGYYGYPYSVAVKKDLMRFMMRMKMNTYLYGAKSDPYHSNNWQDAYPTSITSAQEKNGWMTQDMIREICEVSAETKVNFIWAIHPGNNFLGSSTVISDIMKKYASMYELGVRQFGVFVDDVSIPSTDADMDLNAQRITQLQQSIEKRWNAEGAIATDTVRPLHFVPQVYCTNFASAENYKKFFTALVNTPSNVTIYTTGNGVWSVPNVGDFNAPAQYLGREVGWWWNYPCNDNADAQLYPMDMYKNFSDMPSVSGSARLPADMQNRGMGIISNPMQEGEVSKIPLFSVADYSWNTNGFVNETSWAASFSYILDETHAAALKTLAPYLTKNDPSGKFTTSMSATKLQGNISELLEAIEITKGLQESEKESDRLMWNDLKCWVLKLEAMLESAQKMSKAKEGTEKSQRWMDYVAAMETLDDLSTNDIYQVYSLEGMGANVPTAHRVALPSESNFAAYLEAMRVLALKDMFPATATKPQRFTNTEYTPTVTLSGLDVYMTYSGKKYEQGDFVGFVLPNPQCVTSALIADTLCNSASVYYSPNGHDWTRVVASGDDNKALEGQIKYIVVVNESSTPAYWKFTKNVLKITLRAEPAILSVSVPSGNDYNTRTNFYDGNYSTWWCVNANQKTGDSYTLNLSVAAPIRKVRVGIGTVNDDYMKTGRIEISEDGSTWTKLSPVGQSKTYFTMNDMNVYSDECKTLDFVGNGKEAKYIRLYNQSANTSKWLRIYEIQPFYDLIGSPAADTPEICDALPYSCVSVKKGSTITYNILSAYDVEGAEVYTNNGIISLSADDIVDNVVSFTADEDMKVYEVMVAYSSLPSGVVGISQVQNDVFSTRNCNGGVWDMAGRSIKAESLKSAPRGVYIVNGRKILR